MIEFFRFAAKALAATAITVVAVIGDLLFFTFATPSETVEIPLSDLGMTARVEVRSDFNSHVYWLRATTPYGSMERRLWEHWGPATRINFYRTPDDWLVMLGGGGSAEMIHLKRANEVQGPLRKAKTATDSSNWTYIGAFDRSWNGSDGYRFFSPSEKKECFPMFGAGSSSYRIKYQAQSRCD